MNSKKPGPLLTAATLLLLLLVWGSTWAAVRVSLDSMPPFTGASLRFVVGCVALLLVGRFLGVRHGTSARERKLWLVVAILSFVISYGVVYWAELWIPSGLASVLFATFPLMTAVLAHFFLPDDRLRRNSVLGILLGIAGVTVIYSSDLEGLGKGNALLASMVMLISPLVSAITQTCVKRWGQGIHPFALTAVPMGIAAGVLGALAFVLERNEPMRFDLPGMGAVVFLGLCGSALTFSLYYWLLSYYPSSRLALLAFGTPVVAVTIGAAFLDEPYTARSLGGSALVLLGVAWATISPTKRKLNATASAKPDAEPAT